jgi:DNA-binding IclR family transcriptional regulator
LEALEGTNFEPVTIQRVEQRTHYPYDFCRRALITLKLAGFAAEVRGKWTVGPKLMRFGTNFNEVCLAYARRPDSEKTESGGGNLQIS